MRRGLRRIFVIGCLATASVAVSSSPAAAAVTIGQTGAPTGICASNEDWAQLTVSSGNSYVVPATGAITSWSHQASPSGAGQKLKLKVYRQVAGLTYTVVAQEARDLIGGVLNTFPTSIAVRLGDVLGLTTAPDSSTQTGCGFGPLTETDYVSNTDAPTGAQVTFSTNFNSARLNVSAVVEPTNTFSFGQTTRNKKKGTATLTVVVPNAGELAVSGKGAKEASVAGAGATTAKSVPTAGTVQLTIKAKGKKRRKLNQTGKVKLNPRITFTPTGGSPTTQSTKVKLKKS